MTVATRAHFRAPPAVPIGATAMELPTPESGAERLLVDMLRQVVMLRAPESVDALDGGRLGDDSSGESIARSLQTVGLLSQILPIAELHDAMEARQRVERERGFESLTGTFAKVIAEWKQLGVPADTVRELLRTFRVVPTITAHPTEAKRVTVLEKLRGIYTLLVKLDGAARHAARARAARGGAAHGARPALDDGRAQAREADGRAGGGVGAPLLRHDAVRSRVAAARLARARAGGAVSGRALRSAELHRSSARGWAAIAMAIRTSRTRSRARRVREYRAKSLHRYQRRVAELSRALSISERSANFSPAFQAALARALEASNDGERLAARNPGELCRQWLSVVQRRLAATVERESSQARRRGAHVAAVCDGGRSHCRSQDAREGADRCGLRGDRACDGGAGAARGGGVPVLDGAAGSAPGIGVVQRGGGGAAHGARRR